MSIGHDRHREVFALAVFWILAVVRFQERARYALLSPNRSARAARGREEGGISFFEVARDCRLSFFYAGIVTVVDDCARHPTEDRFDNVEELRASRK